MKHGDGGRELPTEENRGMTFKCLCGRSYLTALARGRHVALYQ